METRPDGAHPDSNKLGPIEFEVMMLTTLTALLLVAVIAGAVFGSGSGLGFSGNEVCGAATSGVIPADAEVAVPGLGTEARAHLPVATLLTGFALFTFGQVLQRGVAMQADIDATI